MSTYELGGCATIKVSGDRERRSVTVVEVIAAADELFVVRDGGGQEHYAAPSSDFNDLQPAEPDYAI